MLVALGRVADAEALFERLRDLGAQAWLTGTDRALFQGLARDAQGFEVRDGTMRPTEDQG